MSLELATQPRGIVVRETAEAYHANTERISRTMLWHFRESPRTYFKRYVERDPKWQDEPTAAMQWGDVFHDLVLQTNDITSRVAVIPEEVLNDQGHRKGKNWLTWKAENEGKLLLKDEEFYDYAQMWESIQSCETARELLFDGDAAENELGLHWTDSATGLLLRSRLDRVIPGECITDLKTINDASLRNINNEIKARGYDLQAGTYQWGWEETTGQTLPFYFVFVQKSKPYTVVVVRMKDSWTDKGRTMTDETLNDIKRCHETGDWSDPVSQGFIEMDEPSWANERFSWNIGG